MKSEKINSLKQLSENNTDAMVELAGLYSIGSEVEKDTNKSIELYQKAASKGHRGAQVVLGKI